MLDDTDRGRVDIINNSILVARRLRNGKERSVEEAFPWINNLNRTEWKSVWMKDREGGRGGEEMNDSLETRRFLYYYRSILEAGSDIDNVNECRLLSPDNTDKFHIYVMVSTSWLEPGEEQRKLVYPGEEIMSTLIHRRRRRRRRIGWKMNGNNACIVGIVIE